MAELRSEPRESGRGYFLSHYVTKGKVQKIYRFQAQNK